MCRGGVTCSSGGLAKTCVVVFLLSAVGKLDASLLVTNGTHIIDYDISTNQQTVLPVSEPGGIVALAVDVGGQRLYYTNAETGGIVRCGLDGSNQHAVVNTDVTQPTGIAYDWVSGLVYWTDEGRGTVEVAQGDGSNRKTLISGQLFPRGIAVDPIAGYLFWGNQGDFTIKRARLDGSDVETLHNTGLVWPNELVVDFPNSRLYWIEGYFGYIGSSALDGTDRTIVANVSSGYVLFGLALQDDTLYYTSWEGKLFSVDQNSGEQSEIVMEGQGEQLLGLVSVHPSRQPAGSNQCQSDNGDCSHLCLPTGPDSRICTCPDDGGLAIGKDNKTCAEPGQFLLYAKADEGQIMMLTMDLSMAARPVLLDQGVRPVAVAYDPVEQRVYWSDVVTHTINRVFLNGTGSEVFMDSANGIASVEGLAVDWQNQRLYFSNLGLHYTGVAWGRVEMVGLDRTGHRRLLEGRVGKPRSIVLDMQARHMYITDWGEEPKILRADLDGRNPQTIVSSEMENPNGLAISDGKLYWVDSHVKSGVNSTGTLEQADLDGTNRAVLMQDVPFHIPFGLAVQDSTVYWTAWGQDGTGAVFQGNSGTGDHRVVVGGLGDPMAVTICNKSYTTPDEPDPCAGHDCSHICVPTAGSYRCMCPNTGGLGLASDGKSCIEPQQFLLIADLTEIRMVPLDTLDRYPYPIIQVHDLYSNIAAVTYDPETKTVYFSDVGCRSILKALLNGTGLEVVHRDTGVSDGMTVDPVDRYLYWTDGERGTIERIALDGDEETHEVVLQGLDRPRAIVVISDTNYMYWTDWGEIPAVKRASIEVNATDVQSLVEGGLSWPNGLVVDNEGKLYVGDGNNTKIEAALLDGSDRQLILDESSGHVYGLAKVGDVLLWSDWAGQSVKMMTLGSDEIQVLTDGLMRPSELHSSNITDGLLTPTTHVSTTTTAATTLAITTTQVTTPVPTTTVTTPVITTRVTTPVPTTTVTTPVITTEVTTPAPITTTTTATTPVITTEVTTPVPTTTATTPVITTEVTTPVPTTTTATTPVITTEVTTPVPTTTTATTPVITTEVTTPVSARCKNPGEEYPCFTVCKSETSIKKTLPSDSSSIVVDFSQHVMAVDENGLQTVPISDDYEFPESSLDALDGDFLSKTYTFNAIFTIDGLPDRFCSISIHLTDNTPPTASCPKDPVILEGDECSEVDVSEHCNIDWFTDNVGIPENICDADKASSTGFDVLPGIPTTVEWQIRDISGVSSEDECTIEFVCQALAPECENLPTIPKFGALACGKKKQGGQQCVLFCHKTKLMILSDTLSTNLINCNGEEWDQTLGGRSCDRVTKPGATEKYVNFSFSSKKCETNPEEFEEHILEVLYNYQEDHDLACKTSENDINKICDAKIKFHCGSKVNNRRRRQLATFITNVTIHLGVSESFSYTGDETVVEAQLLALSTWVQKTVDILQALVTSGNFTIIMNGTVFTADPQSFSSSPLQTVCRSGQVIVGSRCYPCPAGYHHDSLNNTCLSCPYHTYQEQEQQVTCLPCPNGTITIRDGAVGLEECIPGLVDSTSHLSPKVFLALGFIFGFAIGVLALARYCKKQKSNKVTTVKPFVPKNDLQQVIGNDGHAHGYPLKTKDKATSDWVIIPKTLPKGKKITPGPMHLSAWDTCCTDPKASMDPGRVLLPRTPIPPNKIVVRDKGTPPPQVPNIVESDC